MMLWRTPCEEFDRKCAIPMVKHDDDSVTVSPARNLENCIMNRFYYRDIFEQSLQPSINRFKLGQRCNFMHDNDRKHTSGLIKDWLKRKRIQTLS